MTSRLQCLIFMWLGIQNDLKVAMFYLDVARYTE